MPAALKFVVLSGKPFLAQISDSEGHPADSGRGGSALGTRYCAGPILEQDSRQQDTSDTQGSGEAVKRACIPSYSLR
jgi:hypothetical protein